MIKIGFEISNIRIFKERSSSNESLSEAKNVLSIIYLFQNPSETDLGEFCNEIVKSYLISDKPLMYQNGGNELVLLQRHEGKVRGSTGCCRSSSRSVLLMLK